MKLLDPIWRFSALIIFVLTVFAFNSCRKDKYTEASKNGAIINAQAWYEKKYASKGIKKSAILSPDTSTGSNGVDFTKLTRPGWKNALVYSRFNEEVIEAPVDLAFPINIELKDMSTGRSIFKKEYSRSAFLLMKDGNDYQAFLMVIIADSAYVKGDLSKLNNNHYNKHDADFSGLVMYYTPNGEFVSSWIYNNGKITASSKNIIAQKKYEKLNLKKENTVMESCTYFITIVTSGNNPPVVSFNPPICKLILVSDGVGNQEQPNPGGGGMNNVPCPANTNPEDGGFPSPSGNPHNPGQQGGGCPAGGVTPEPPPPIDTLKLKIYFCDGMTDGNKQEFIRMFGYLQNGTCLQKALLDAVAASGRHITICIDPGLNNVANASSGANGDINFADAGAFGTQIMTDEFFHQMQFSLYGSPMAPNRIGTPNIEFESDLFRDIATHNSNAIIETGQADIDTYKDWLNIITHGGTYTPKTWADIAPDAAAEQEYFHIVELYNNRFPATSPHHGTVDYNRKPLAVIDVINKSNCN